MDLDIVASALESLQSLGAGKGSAPVSPANHEAVLCRTDPCPASPADNARDNYDSGMMPQQGSKQADLPSEVVAANQSHPVVSFGWRKPLCHVHCNGLVGQFLGGHDRDLYIRCVANEQPLHADLGMATPQVHLGRIRQRAPRGHQPGRLHHDVLPV